MVFDPKDRAEGIGASEAAACLGLSRYRSPLEVYLDKIKDTYTPRPETPATRRGKRLEVVVGDMYEEEHGAIVRDLPKAISLQHPFMFANLDAIRKDDRRPVELKTANIYKAPEWGDPDSDIVPTEYLVQITHQMIVTQQELGDLAVLINLDDFRRYGIRLDVELSEMIVEGERNFWKRVENRDPPPPLTGEEATLLWRKSKPNGIMADENIAAIYRELVETRRAIKPLEEKEKKLIGDIKLFLGESDTLLVEDKVAVTWKTGKETTFFDVKGLELESPETFARFQKPKAGNRTFLIKGVKDD